MLTPVCKLFSLIVYSIPVVVSVAIKIFKYLKFHFKESFKVRDFHAIIANEVFQMKLNRNFTFNSIQVDIKCLIENLNVVKCQQKKKREYTGNMCTHTALGKIIGSREVFYN